jgi:hypothetical protein
MKSLSNQDYFILVDHDDDMIKLDRPWLWFSGNEVEDVIIYLEQTGRKIRKILVPEEIVLRFS